MEQAIMPRKEKNKFLAFFIGITLGPLGFHNFYLGRWKRGAIQFLTVLLTLTLGLLITIPWAWTEAFLILIGKYSMNPKEDAKLLKKNQSLESEEVKIKPLKEYLITGVLLCSLLVSVPFSFGFSILGAIIFYYLVGGLWNKFTKHFVKTILPIYANIFTAGKKFLIRFSGHKLPPAETRLERLRSTRKLSFTAVLVLLFMMSIFAQSNIAMVTEGDIPEAVICNDGSFEEKLAYCDDDSSATACDSDCVLENSSAMERILAAYMDVKTMLIFMFAPFVTILVAPILVLRYSSLSIVDKETRSINPIGEKASDVTNVVMGAGAIVLFFQTALNIAQASVDDGNFTDALPYIAYILFITLLLVFLFYPLIWLPMLKFTKSFESHVLLLDNSLVKSKGIEIHNLDYKNNELRITPATNNPAVIDNGHLDRAVLSTKQKVVPEVFEFNTPSPDAVAQTIDDDGYEWISSDDGRNWYRPQGSNGTWIELLN